MKHICIARPGKQTQGLLSGHIFPSSHDKLNSILLTTLIHIYVYDNNSNKAFSHSCFFVFLSCYINSTCFWHIYTPRNLLMIIIFLTLLDPIQSPSCWIRTTAKRLHYFFYNNRYMNVFRTKVLRVYKHTNPTWSLRAPPCFFLGNAHSRSHDLRLGLAPHLWNIEFCWSIITNKNKNTYPTESCLFFSHKIIYKENIL